MVAITHPSDHPGLICVNCQSSLAFELGLEMEVPRSVKAEHIHSVPGSGIEKWSVVCANCGHYTTCGTV
jgi:hypothetical protein